MNQRERTLSIILLVGISVAAGLFFGYQFILSPMQAADRQITELISENDKKSTHKLEIEEKLAHFYNPHRKLSLPADVDLAGRDYEVALSGLLRKSDYQAGSFTITQRPPDAKNTPKILGKKTAYTRLTFLVNVKGELHCLVEFLDLFYRQPLLHQIRALTITRPGRAGARQRGREELEVNFTIEALVLENAETRPTLIHVPEAVMLVAGPAAGNRIAKIAVEGGKGSPYELPRGFHIAPEEQIGRLAVPDRTYAAITGKNVFFGPPPPVRVAVDPKDDEPKEPDLGPYIRLTSLSEADGHARAHLFDFYNKCDYHIEQTAKGGITVEGFWYIGERKRSLMRTKEAAKSDLEVGDQNGGNYVRYHVLKIADSDLYLQLPEDEKVKKVRQAGSVLVGGAAALGSSGKIFKWHIGALLSEMKALRPSEVREELAGVVLAMPSARIPR